MILPTTTRTPFQSILGISIIEKIEFIFAWITSALLNLESIICTASLMFLFIFTRCPQTWIIVVQVNRNENEATPFLERRGTLTSVYWLRLRTVLTIQQQVPFVRSDNWLIGCDTQIMSSLLDDKWLNLRTVLGKPNRQLAEPENNSGKATCVRHENRSATVQCWVTIREREIHLRWCNSNSNLPLTRSGLFFPSGHIFYDFTDDNSNSFSRYKEHKHNRKNWIYFCLN